MNEKEEFLLNHGQKESCLKIKSQYLLAVAMFFSSWGFYMWDFAVGLYFVQLTPGSFRLTATYGLAWTTTAFVFGPSMGRWIDRSNRITVIRYSLIVQNLMIVIDAILIYVLFNFKFESQYITLLLYFLVIILGSFASLIGQGEKISIQRDWIVVCCKGDNNLLAKSNALLRRVDLVVAIVAPIAVGFILSVISRFVSIIFICSWNILSLVSEYYILNTIYKQVPELSLKKGGKTLAESNPTETPNKDKKNTEGKDIDNEENNNVIIPHAAKQVVLAWKIYMGQTSSIAGISLAFLHLTVLAFHSIFSGYAYEQGLSEFYVSICFALGSISGIIGTFIFPILRSKFGIVKTGAFGFLSQWCMLLLCVAAIWAPGSPSTLLPSTWYSKNETLSLTPIETVPLVLTSPSSIKKHMSVIMIMGGTILSRFGLWILDLSITQIQQEFVPENERGTIGAVQYALSELLELSSFVFAILLPLPKQFGHLILISFSAVTIAGMTYHIFMRVYNKRFGKHGYAIINGDTESG